MACRGLNDFPGRIHRHASRRIEWLLAEKILEKGKQLRAGEYVWSSDASANGGRQWNEGCPRNDLLDCTFL
jgi:hypothetical protein